MSILSQALYRTALFLPRKLKGVDDLHRVMRANEERWGLPLAQRALRLVLKRSLLVKVVGSVLLVHALAAVFIDFTDVDNILIAAFLSGVALFFGCALEPVGEFHHSFLAAVEDILEDGLTEEEVLHVSAAQLGFILDSSREPEDRTGSEPFNKVELWEYGLLGRVEGVLEKEDVNVQETFWSLVEDCSNGDVKALREVARLV